MQIHLVKYNRKIRAQAMVEFAIVLPILLVLLFGILEVGRLIFIFSSVSNASRQAARFGSVSGEINTVSFYQDCDGIREAANQSALITEFNTINITYDRGINPDGTQIPIAGIDPNPAVDSCPVEGHIIRNGDRIIVRVSANYVPFLSIIPIEPIEIVSTSARSFLISIPIFGSAMPKEFAAESSTPSTTPIIFTLTDTPIVDLTSTLTRIPSSGGTNTPYIYLSPTNTLPATVTFTPSMTFTPSNTPSITPTQISCSGLSGVTHGPLTFKDNVMAMSVNNRSGYVLTTAQIYLEWNHNQGHGKGNDPGLRLRQIMFAEQVWNGDIQTPSTYIVGYHPTIPIGESTIQFIFHQNYSQLDGTERVIINISTPGCINYPVDSRN